MKILDLSWKLLFIAAIIVATIQYLVYEGKIFPFLNILFLALFFAGGLIKWHVTRKK
jgi:hypothetical protein